MQLGVSIMPYSQTERDTVLISIGIPTMNRRHDLPTSIGSILKQDFGNYELLISDNASTDDTQAYCEELARKYPQIRYIRQEKNLGMMPNWNFLLEEAEGKYFMWLGDDDWLEDGVLTRYVEFLESHDDYVLVSGAINYWHQDEFIRREQGLSVEQESAMMRTSYYYAKAKDGALVYGLLRLEQAQKIIQKNTIGPDWHFVSAMAFQGKVKQFDFIAYNKVLGGSSADFVRYAKVMNLNPFWGRAPYIRIALDAFREILYGFPIYQSIGVLRRLILALISFFAVLFHFYIIRYPVILGGRFLRFLGIKTPSERRKDNGTLGIL